MEPASAVGDDRRPAGRRADPTAMPPTAQSRKNCYRCRRAASMCVCGDLPVVETRTELIILQHPRERYHPLGTARLAKLGIARARIEIAFGSSEHTVDHPIEVPPDAVVLYPRDEALDLDELPPAERPTTLIALDGTWPQSRRLYAHNHWLHTLRHVRIHPESPSRYRIRKQPRRECLSTLESIVVTLKVLEPETAGLDGLLDAFERMIDRQIAHVDKRGSQPRRKLRRNRPSRRVPATLESPALVVVYSETSLPGGDDSSTRELVQWTAMRIATGEVFEALISPSAAPPCQRHLGHMGLDQDMLAAGMTLSAARTAFVAFAGAAPVLAAWNETSLRWARQALEMREPEVLLKSAYCNLRGGRPGTLEDVIQAESLAPAMTGCRGRAESRLGNAVAVARWMQQHTG